MRGTALQAPRAGEEGAAPCSRAEIPLRLPSAAMERWLSPCSPRRAQGCRDPHAAPGGAHAGAGGCLKEAVTPREDLCWSRVLAESVERGALIGEGLYPMERDLCWST